MKDENKRPMITVYPAFAAALAAEGVDALAERSGIPADTIRAIGSLAPTMALRDRLARVLDADPTELFRMDDDLEQALAAAPSRCITDPETLRKIDGVRRRPG